MAGEAKTLYLITNLSESEAHVLENLNKLENVRHSKTYLSSWLNKDPRESLTEKEMQELNSRHHSDSGKNFRHTCNFQ